MPLFNLSICDVFGAGGDLGFSALGPPPRPRSYDEDGTGGGVPNSAGHPKTIWVNYNELTTSSLEIIVSKGNHPQMALIQVSELL